MQPVRFRVRGYKSVIDSGDCWLASDLTILAGKNESGKTAILEALRDFNTEVKIDESAVSLGGMRSGMMVQVWLKPTGKEWKELKQLVELSVAPDQDDLVLSDGIEVTKNFWDQYSLNNDFATRLDVDHLPGLVEAIEAVRAVAIELGAAAPVKFPKLAGLASDRLSVLDYEEAVEKHVQALVAGAARSRGDAFVAALNHATNELPSLLPSERLRGEIEKRLPRFVFFSDFENLLPAEIKIADAVKNPSVGDFAKSAGLDLGRLAKMTDAQARKNLLSRHSAAVTGAFGKHWLQDKVILSADADGEHLRFYVSEVGATVHYKPNQRSRGFQWFLSFFLRMNAEGASPGVVLIDEPGLCLHATAQKDVVTVLEGVSKHSPVIFSTHSPYLINADRLDRIRLVLNDRSAKTRRGTI